ncbi:MULTISPECIES: HNH endonuclease signature motif containing protein [Nocardiaceae]|uniref:HNH nuclease domain-containing protein n=1 Tax=Rhodococcoides corynebacterioides TaxID=53972 RepID=A0ABS2KWU6_9NOCA|nr:MULTISPECIES: HNH endonuclease signature motif containing protein [Rhodococcus]MBM7416392.1 hypothetical protein [Rhodococcus corynebacterioides]MBP1114645.1 hypothetical protein [Rhodococcus sp. PvP016]
MIEYAVLEPPTVAEIRQFATRLSLVDDYETAASDIDAVRALEELKSVGAAAQASVTDHVSAVIRSDRRDRGVAQNKWDAGIASQVGLARRESHHRGGTYLGLARAVVQEMPHTHALMRRGLLNEYRAMLLVRETAHLSAEDRREVDRRLCAEAATLDGKGDLHIVAMASAVAQELDAASVVKRNARAKSQRRVSVRPAPEFMAYVNALMPMDQAVCVYATLRRDADAMVGSGLAGDRTRDQVMADLLFERVTGASAAQGAPVAVQMVMSDETLLAGGDEAAYVPGYGTVPAASARRLVADSVDTGGAGATLRRVYANPTTAHLTAMESSARTFPAGLASYIDIRDRTCRTPWCDAPIRHHDHITPHRFGGPTTADNGMGLCAACNYAKEADGWETTRIREDVAGLHIVRFRTATGHTYDSEAPASPRPMSSSSVEVRLDDLMTERRAG